MHPMLARQLRKLDLAATHPPPDSTVWQQFIARVDRAYTEAEQDRYLLERSLAISSREMQDLYAGLHQSEARFRSLVQNGADVCVIVDVTGTVRYISPAVAHVMGYEPDGFIDQSGLPFVHPDDLEAAHELLAEVAQKPGALRSVVLRAQHADGRWRWLDVAVRNLLHDPSVNGLAVNFHDITERKQAQEALATSEARFRSLVQNSSDMIAVIGVTGEVEYVTPSVTSVLGYSAEDMCGTSVFTWLHPADLDTAQAGFMRVLHAQSDTERAAVERPVAYRLRHRDGGWCAVETRTRNLLDDPAVQGIVINVHDTTERLVLEEQLAYQAFHDSLTGLPNRARFMERLSSACAHGTREPATLAVLFLDLDGFKVINDSLGHRAGDRLLISIGERVTAALRPGDMVARFGGDEFAVLLEGIGSSSDAYQIAMRVMDSLRQPVALDGRLVSVTASIGITVPSAEPVLPDDLLREADTALYQAKAAGKNLVMLFDSDMATAARARLEMETGLRRAVERGEFELHYQPVVDLRSGQMTGVEALVRWRHPERGLISPAEFIPLAEETGLIVPLGRWILEEACRQAAAWQHADPAGSHEPFVMAVNLSGRQFARPELAAEVAEALERAGLAPQALCLEITESTMMHDVEQAVTTLVACKALGVRIAIDDFGTGYSSLSYLSRFPVDVLKIDRSFVQQLGQDRGATAVVRAVTATAKALDLEVVVEGIETPQQLRQVRRLGCQHAQGYYFDRPLSATVLTTRFAIDRTTPEYGPPRTRSA